MNSGATVDTKAYSVAEPRPSGNKLAPLTGLKRNLTRKMWGEQTNDVAEIKIKELNTATNSASFVSRTNTIRQSEVNHLVDNR